MCFAAEDLAAASTKTNVLPQNECVTTYQSKDTDSVPVTPVTNSNTSTLAIPELSNNSTPDTVPTPTARDGCNNRITDSPEKETSSTNNTERTDNNKSESPRKHVEELYDIPVGK